MITLEEQNGFNYCH